MELSIQFVNHRKQPQYIDDDRAQIIHLNEQTHITIRRKTQTETLTILLIHHHHQFYYYYLTFVNKFGFFNEPSVRSTLSYDSFYSGCGSAGLPYPSSLVAFLEIGGFWSD